MTNRPKQIGTAAETAVVRYARAHGHPDARRQVLAGNRDNGDIWLAPGIILEIKAGHAAEQAGPTLLVEWWAQTLTERTNSGATIAALITKRKGVSGARCGAWTAHLDVDTFTTLLGAPRSSQAPHAGRMVRMTLDDLLALATTYTKEHQ